MTESYKYRTPMWSRLLVTGIIFGSGTFFSFIAFKSNAISIGLAICISAILLAISIVIFRKTGSVKAVTVDDEKLLLPYGPSGQIVKFEDVSFVREVELQGSSNIRIERKNGSPLHIPSTHLQDKDYFDLLDFLEQKFPAPQVSNSLSKLLDTKNARYVLPLIVFVFAVIFSPAFRNMNHYTVLVIALSGTIITLASVANGKMSTFKRQNKEILAQEPWRSKRRTLNWTITSLIISFIIGALSVFPFRTKDSLYISPNFIWLGIIFSALIYLVLDQLFEMKKFVSPWERGTFLFSIILFGTLPFLVAVPDILYRTKYLAEEKKIVSTLRADPENSNCFLVNHADIVGDVSFCNYKEKVDPKAQIEFKSLQSKVCLNIYYEFKIKK